MIRMYFFKKGVKSQSQFDAKCFGTFVHVHSHDT